MRDDPEDLIDENRRRLSAATLREWTQNGVWSGLRAHITTDGTLVISGHVLGPGASLIGDELEYWIEVEPKYLDRLSGLLSTLVASDDVDISTIPARLKLAFDRAEFEHSSQVTEWMKQHKIPSSFSSYP